MRLIGREKLMTLGEQDRDTAKWVVSWIAELRDAHWKRPADVTGQFPRARQQDDGSFVFPVPRRQVGINVLMAFSRGLALVLAIKGLKATNGH